MEEVNPTAPVRYRRLRAFTNALLRDLLIKMGNRTPSVSYIWVVIRLDVGRRHASGVHRGRYRAAPQPKRIAVILSYKGEKGTESVVKFEVLIASRR